MELKEKIGNGLYELRNKEGMTRQEFSELAEISLNSYSSIENGKSLIKLNNLEKLLFALSRTLSEFFLKLNL